jgi:hypothetical protein
VLSPDGKVKLPLATETHSGAYYLGKLERTAEVAVAVDGHLGDTAQVQANFGERQQRTLESRSLAEFRDRLKCASRVVSDPALAALKLADAEFQMAGPCRCRALMHGRATIELNADSILISVLPVPGKYPDGIG